MLNANPSLSCLNMLSSCNHQCRDVLRMNPRGTVRIGRASATTANCYCATVAVQEKHCDAISIHTHHTRGDRHVNGGHRVELTS
eukprot:m.216176 g.216176  ORF g.216176 m.216176 type:complete len:84 (+) comp15545_c0_seq12:2638-2889(+)